MANYIQSIRGKVGHMPIILNSCAGVLFDDQGRILLQERTDTNNWSLPGGYMEYGENFEQTIIREYKEDSGLEIKPVKQLAVFDQGFTEYPNGDVCQVISVLFEVEKVGGRRITERQFETIGTDFFDSHHIPPLLNEQTQEMLDFAFEYKQQ